MEIVSEIVSGSVEAESASAAVGSTDISTAVASATLTIQQSIHHCVFSNFLRTDEVPRIG